MALSKKYPNNSGKGYLGYLDTPIGQIEIRASEHAITAISRCQSRHKRQDLSNHLIKQCQQQLTEYFSGKREVFDLPLGPQGTAFQQQVWQALRKIPYGAVISYAQLAQQLGRSKGSSRAVGQANNKNPLMIVIPCHRVCGSNGDLVGYAGGLNIKKKLLQLEQPQTV
jgi:methylated-DNA-[protein]-cysteine S-methyltransferase